MVGEGGETDPVPGRQVYARSLAFYVYKFLVEFGNAVNHQVTLTTLLEAGPVTSNRGGW